MRARIHQISNTTGSALRHLATLATYSSYPCLCKGRGPRRGLTLVSKYIQHTGHSSSAQK